MSRIVGADYMKSAPTIVKKVHLWAIQSLKIVCRGAKTGEDCRVANAPRNDKYASSRSNDKAGPGAVIIHCVIASAARQSSPVIVNEK